MKSNIKKKLFYNNKMSYSDANLKKLIQKIIDERDLSQLSKKQIYDILREQYNIDVDRKKDLIKTLIVEAVNAKNEEIVKAKSRPVEPKAISDAKLKQLIQKIIDERELSQLSKKQIYDILREQYNIDVDRKKDLIKTLIVEAVNAKNEKIEADVKVDDMKVSTLTVLELRKLLASKGITTGLTTKNKQELIELYYSDRCNPSEDLYCDDDKYCDIRNNVCVKSNVKGLYEMNIKGKKIMGSKTALNELNNLLKKKELELLKKAEESTTTEEKMIGKLSAPEPEEVKEEEVKEAEVERVEEKVKISPPPLLESQDIENVLSEIMDGGDDLSDILNQESRERLVCRCLGLMV